MYFTKQADGFRAHFAVAQGNGSLRTGLLAGDFTVTVVDPADSTTLTPSVSESTQKSGSYFFDITSGFITTNGVGDYGVVVEVDTFAGPSSAPHVRDVFGEVLRVTEEDFDTLATPGDEMDLVTDAVDANAVATTGAQEIRDEILSDATPFAGANIDAAVSSRAAPGDAMDLITDAVDSDSVATSGANEIRDAILSDSTPFAGASIDATISSRASQASLDGLIEALVADSLTATAGSSSTEVRTGATQADGFYDELVLVVVNAAGVAARRISGYLNTNGAFTVDPALPFTPAVSDPVYVLNQLASSVIDTAVIVDAIWDEDIVAAHGTADTAGLILRALGALISQRTNNANLNALLGVADTPGTDLPEQVDTELTAQHGVGDWNLSEADVQSALTAQGYTVARAGNLDNLDQAITTTEANILAAISGLNDLSVADVQTALTNQGYTAGRATNLDNLDATISSVSAAVAAVSAAIAALNDLSSADVQAALTAQGYTIARAALLDNLSNLDATVSSVNTAIAALNDLSIADVQTAMTSQGYTAARAILLDNLDATISSVIAAISALNNLSAVDVWSELVPGAFPAGSAGARLGNLDAGDDRTHFSVAYDDVNQIFSATYWLERSGQISTPVNSLGTVTVYNPDGTTLFTNSSPSGPDAQGVLRFSQTPIVLVDNTAYYADVTVEDASGLQTTRIGIPFQA